MTYLNRYVGASGADDPQDPGDKRALDYESPNLEAREQVNVPPPEVGDSGLKPATVSKAQKKKKRKSKV